MAVVVVVVAVAAAATATELFSCFARKCICQVRSALGPAERGVCVMLKQTAESPYFGISNPSVTGRMRNACRLLLALAHKSRQWKMFHCQMYGALKSMQQIFYFC